MNSGHGTGGAGRSMRPGASPQAAAFEARTGIKAPRIVAWEITRSCNLACAHCRAAAHCAPYEGELSLDECKRVMDDIASICDPILILTGGEPLMRADIFDIIDYARALGMHPVIGTNGTLIDDAMAARIAEHGIPRVSVSIDFPDAAGQDAFRGQAGAYEAAIAGMRNLRAHGVGVQVNATVTKMNKHLLDDLHELALREDSAAFHPFLLVPTGRGADLADVELSPEEYEEVLTWAFRCQQRSPLQFKPTDAPQYMRIAKQLGGTEGDAGAASGHGPAQGQGHGMHSLTRGCLGGISFAFISHVGDVQPCGYFDMQLGNVRDMPFSQIWETSPVFDDLRHFERLRGKCGACEFRGICGGCRARALAATGDYLAEEPYCAYVPRKVARQRVLDEIQSGFPLASDPYGTLAERLGLAREQVLRAMQSLREDGTIRQISASIASKKLKYASTLCAMAAPGGPDQIDRVAAAVSAHPEVTHNYLRDAEYNIWFTAIAPTAADLEQLACDIAAETGCDDILNLPVETLYKIRVDFGKGHGAGAGAEDAGATGRPGASAPLPFDENDPFDRALIRWAQSDATGEHPFRDAAICIAAQTGDAEASEQRVIERLQQWKACGLLRRYGAFVRHRQLGYTFNGMAVWSIPDERTDSVGRLFAEQPYVSHCYKRTTAPTWPYNIYAMVHAKTQDELDERIAQLEALCGLPARVLVSTKEYKKALPSYFGGPLETEAQNSGLDCPHSTMRGIEQNA